ncbi:MAG: transcriptional regulator [Deltaproteobacteria bacterium]|nr:transcriptional regulator [Deltaproteobacteria bacterium]
MEAKVQAVLDAEPGSAPERAPGTFPSRWFAVGDPQCSLERLARVLCEAGLLGDHGALREDVGLVSLGDHFDYGDDRAVAAREGLRVLRWLTGHPPWQVRVLLGNHDAARVQEFAGVSDARFEEAFAAARGLDGDPAAAARHREAFPKLPVWNLVARDYSSFTSEQRALVRELLLAGRYALGLAAALPDGTPALLTHAGVTRRELRLLGLDAATRDAAAVARALQAALSAAVEAVRDDWRAGGEAPLRLAPLHHAGDAEREGGGLLYHRPSNSERSRDGWSWDEGRPRRFDPRTLPLGLAQVAGHTGHHKCLKELGAWATEEARAVPRGGLRTLASDGQSARYELGLHPPQGSEATLYLADAELSRAEVWPVPLLALGGVP